MSSDGFQGCFGNNANAARVVVDAALDYWERAITSFNRMDNSETYSLNISMNATGTGFGANAGISAIVDGKPTAANVTIARGNDTSEPADGIGDGAGWFLDLTPFEHSEFLGTLVNPFSALPGTAAGADLLTPMLHEIGHAVGIYAGGNLDNIATDTTTNDPNGGATGANLWRLDGNNVTALMTGFDSGGATGSPTDAMGPQHFARAGTQWPAANPTHFGAVDLMNSNSPNRSIPSLNDLLMLVDAWNYSITTPEAFGTMHAFVRSNGELLVRGMDGASDDTITIEPLVNGFLRVSVDIGADVPGIGITGPMITDFNPASISRIRIQGLGGNDTIRMGSSFGLPTTIEGNNGNDTIEIGYVTRDLSFFNAAMNITGGNDFDRVFLYNDALVNPVTYTVTDTTFDTSGNFGPLTYSSIELLNPEAGGHADTFNIVSTRASMNLVIHGGNANDVINLAPNNPAGVAVINGPVSIHGEDGDDTVNIGSGNLDAITGLVTFDGGLGGGALGNRIILDDTTTGLSFNYNITTTSLTQSFLFGGLNYSNTDRIILHGSDGENDVTIANGIAPILELYGHGGNDDFIVGGGNVGFQPARIYDGGEGIDGITFDDQLNSSNSTWIIQPNLVTFFGGVFAVSTSAFESVKCLAGTGANTMRILGTMNQNIAVDAGLGLDTVILEDVSNFRDFFEGENDPPFHFDLDLEGGDGFDILTVDDTASVDRIYSIRPDNVMGLEGAPLGLDVDYVGFQDMNFLGGAFIDEYYVFGTPPDIFLGGAGQIEILGNGSQDSLILFPRNAQTQLTINCDITFQGGDGADTVLVDASGSPFGLHYQMAGGTLTGMGAGSVFVSGNAQLTFNAGSGNDIWTTVPGPLSNPPTTINAGGGSNTFNIDASLTPIAWTINGGLHLDTLNLIDTNNPSPSTSWNTNATSITRTRSDGGTLPKVYTHSGVERINVNGGGGGDLFFVDAVAPGQTLTLNAGAGLDGMLLGSQTANNLDSIQGAVAFNGQAGGGNMNVLDASDPTGDTVHLTQTSLGAYPGDNLFGAGGSLTFSDLVNFGVFPGITLNLGTGADTILAQPLPTARVTINANNPTTAPGDKQYLQLELAGAVNPVVSNPSTPNGNVTSSNRQTLNWTGIEQPATVLIPGDYNADGVVGASDLAVWRAAAGVSAAGDGDGDGDTDGADFLVWQRRLGSSNASPASESLAAASSVETDSQQEISWFGLPPGPFPIGATGGSVEDRKIVAANGADARLAVFGRERTRGIASQWEFFESLGGTTSHTPFGGLGRQALVERSLTFSEFESGDDRKALAVDDDVVTLRDLDLAHSEYGRGLTL